ncbi:MAG: hypothetical protein H6727_17445 [Myxococcales bacterium]|nr:hypothetical protein [Myxococcales bacterium]
MRQNRSFSWLAGVTVGLYALLHLAGCPNAPTGGDGGNTEQTPLERSNQKVVFQLDPASPKMPFPCDVLTKEDPSTPTGRRISLTDKKNNGLIDEGLTLFGDIYVQMLNQLDGWSAAGSILVPLEDDVRQDNLPQDKDATPADAAVVLLDVDPNSPDKGKRIPVLAFSKSITKPNDIVQHYLQLKPAFPLRPHTRYLVALTQYLQDKNNKSLAPSEDFLFASGQKSVPSEHPAKDKLDDMKKRLTDPLQMLEKEGFSTSSLSLAFLITTGAGPKALLAARDAVLKEDKVTYTFDPDGDKKDNVYLNPLEAPNVNKKTRTDSILALLTGTFDAPDFRNDKEEWVVEAGVPKLQKWTPVPFLLVLPKAIEQGPVPIVVIQHGLNSYKENMLKMASAFATRGVAVVALDTVAHGDRASKRDQAVLKYMAFTSGLRFLDNFRQSAIEHVQFARLVESFSKLDIYPLGAPDGKPDFVSAKHAYIGHSLGGIIGGLLLGLQPETAMVIAASGGRFEDLVLGILGNFLPTGNEYLTVPVTAVMQQFLDRADPLNTAAWWMRNEPTLWEKRQVLMQQAMNDETMPAEATWSMARTLLLPQFDPILTTVSGLSSEKSTLRALTQFADATHNYILDEGYPQLTVQAQEQAAHFLSTALKTGTAELKAP